MRIMNTEKISHVRQILFRLSTETEYSKSAIQNAIDDLKGCLSLLKEEVKQREPDDAYPDGISLLPIYREVCYEVHCPHCGYKQIETSEKEAINCYNYMLAECEHKPTKEEE